MKKLLVLALVLGFGVSGLLAQSTMKEKTMPGKSAGGGIEQLSVAWAAAANAKDAAKMGALYTEDAVLMPPNQEMVRGRVNIQAFWQTMLDSGARDVSIISLGAWSSGTVGFESGTYEFTMQPATGQPTRDKGKYLVGVRRGTDGKWRLSYDIFNSDLPCPPPAAPAQ